MIISLTGKPCSGKGTVGKIFCEKYNFGYMSTGEIFRELSTKHNASNILEFQLNEEIKNIDRMVDNKTIEIGKTRLNEDIIFDSRLAWHFIPKSFKVFLDVDWVIAGERLMLANREREQAENIEHAISMLKSRWTEENRRYQELYKVDNLNPNQYNLVIDSSNKSPEEIVNIIYEEYKKFMQKA